MSATVKMELALIIFLGLLFLGSTDDRMKASPKRSLVDPSKRIFPKARTNALFFLYLGQYIKDMAESKKEV